MTRPQTSVPNSDPISSNRQTQRWWTSSGGLVDRAVEVTDRNAGLQARLIEDLLDMSPILTGKMVLRAGRTDLSAAVNGAVDSVRAAAAAKSITLEIDIDHSIGPIWGDTHRLHQVVWNLLSISVKFTSNGGSVDVRVRKAESHVEIVVHDSGEGIPADFLPLVFDRFRQAEQGTARQHGGLGMGVAVVRHLVELHGGSVFAKSDGIGQRATLIVRLPFNRYA